MPTYAPPRSRSLPTAGAVPRADAVASSLRRRTGLLLGLVLVLAAALFSLRLGHSSLFIDEVYSWSASRGDLPNLFKSLQETEINPPLYYLLLHGWLQIAGGDSEVALRVPSVLAGVGLVAAVFWLGLLVAGRRAALVAAGLAAVSPLLMIYAQQARSYVWVMLAVTIAVAAAVQGTRDRSWRMLALAAFAAACGVLLHYTALFVLAPLVVWLLCQRDLPLPWRIGFGSAVALPFAALVPLLLDQLSRGHQSILESYNVLSPVTALRVAGTPFDGRVFTGLIAVREIAALVVVEALALLALAERFRRLVSRRLIVACGALPLLGVGLLGAIGQPTALTRYTAVSAPFIIVAIGAVVAHAGRVLAVVLVFGTLVVSVVGVVTSQNAGGQYPNTRAAIALAASNWQEGDQLVGIGYLGFNGALSYYAERLLPRGEQVILGFSAIADSANAPPIAEALADGRRLWFLSDPPVDLYDLNQQLGQFGYRAAATKRYAGNGEIQLIRAEPRP